MRAEDWMNVNRGDACNHHSDEYVPPSSPQVPIRAAPSTTPSTTRSIVSSNFLHCMRRRFQFAHVVLLQVLNVPIRIEAWTTFRLLIPSLVEPHPEDASRARTLPTASVSTELQSDDTTSCTSESVGKERTSSRRQRRRSGDKHRSGTGELIDAKPSSHLDDPWELQRRHIKAILQPSVGELSFIAGVTSNDRSGHHPCALLRTEWSFNQSNDADFSHRLSTIPAHQIRIEAFRFDEAELDHWTSRYNKPVVVGPVQETRREDRFVAELQSAILNWQCLGNFKRNCNHVDWNEDPFRSSPVDEEMHDSSSPLPPVHVSFQVSFIPTRQQRTNSRERRSSRKPRNRKEPRSELQHHIGKWISNVLVEHDYMFFGSDQEDESASSSRIRRKQRARFRKCSAKETPMMHFYVQEIHPVCDRGNSSRNNDTANTKTAWALELITHERIYPLSARKMMNVISSSTSRSPSVMRQNAQHRQKQQRIESFFVARTAEIERGDVVLDPNCGRGTFLIEAAKYWPLATYHGIDVNAGHVEHVRMNARSTSTRIHVQRVDVGRYYQNAPKPQRKAITKMSKPSNVGTETNPSIQQRPVWAFANGSVDKIMSRFPTSKHKGTISPDATASLWMQECCRVLRPGTGRMVLLVNTEDFEPFLSWMHDAAIDTDGCHVVQVRQPFRQGNQLMYTVVLAKGGTELGADLTPIARFPWESVHKEMKQRQSQQSESMVEPGGINANRQDEKDRIQSGVDLVDKGRWSRIRSQTCPLMVPYTSKHFN